MAWMLCLKLLHLTLEHSSQVAYWHADVDGVDYVFVDHNCFKMNGGDLYSGSRQDLLFRCSLLCKAALEAVRVYCVCVCVYFVYVCMYVCVYIVYVYIYIYIYIYCVCVCVCERERECVCMCAAYCARPC
jgi:hypothetical protein